MGICSSCLRGRDHKSNQNDTESSLLLGDDQQYGEGYGYYNNDTQSVPAARDLSEVVRVVQEQLIDVSALDQNEIEDTPMPSEPLGDMNALGELFEHNLAKLAAGSPGSASQKSCAASRAASEVASEQ